MDTFVVSSERCLNSILFLNITADLEQFMFHTKVSLISWWVTTRFRGTRVVAFDLWSFYLVRCSVPHYCCWPVYLESLISFVVVYDEVSMPFAPSL